VPDLDAPIGIFDSGVGGLTVARAVIDQLPAERVVYVGDTAHGPYGPLPIAEIRRHALADSARLVERDLWDSLGAGVHDDSGSRSVSAPRRVGEAHLRRARLSMMCSTVCRKARGKCRRPR